MKLRVFGIENPIEFRQGMVSILEIENSALFRNVVFCLFKLNRGLNPNFSITVEDNNKIEVLSNFNLVTDVFNLDALVSSTKLNKYVLSELEHNLEQHRLIFDNFTQLKSNFLRILDDISFDLCYNEPELLDFVKDFSFKINFESEENYLNNLLNYLKSVKLLDASNLVIFVDLKKYFNENELLEIYRQAFVLDLRLLLIESSFSAKFLENEWKLCVDDDLYETIPLEL